MFAATSFAQLVCESLTRAFTKRDEVIGKLTDFAAFFFICTEHRSKPISALKRAISKLKGEYLLDRFVLPCSKIWSLFRQNLLSKLLPCYRNMSVVNETTTKNWQALAHSLKRLCVPKIITQMSLKTDSPF